MGSHKLTEQELDHLAVGAAILGTGGGGNPYIGKLRVRELLRQGKSIEIIPLDALEDDDLVVSVGGIGAPVVGIEKIERGDECFHALRALEKETGKHIAALIPAEIGGANSMEPMITAAQAGIPVVDADGMGRAFPEIQMMTFFIYGHAPEPAAIADEKGNVVVFRKVIDMYWLERFARTIAVDMGAAAGLAPAYSFSAYVAEVDVDVETGMISCTDVWAAHDCGKALNPLAVEGQIIGSCHMGLGQVLSEQMVYGRTGHLQNPNLLDYKIPSVHEMPNVTPILIESCDPEGPFGAKEAGEGPLLPILPAVVNAVYDAIGIRINDLPLTPDKVWAAIAKKMKLEGIDDPENLPTPRLDLSPLQDKLLARAEVHEDRDSRRQRLEDIDAYANGVLFGLDSNLLLEYQAEGWVASTKPTPEQMEDLGLAGTAWLKEEQRKMGGDN